MRKVIVSIATVIGLVLSSNVAFADSAKPGQSMTHMKTAAGVASTLEAAGVILYVQGGATSAVIGDNLSAATSQVVFHIPVTANKAGVQHVGSNIAATIASVLGLPAGSLPDGLAFGTADVTLYSKLK